MTITGYILFLLAWAALHSFFASHLLKDWLEKRLGKDFLLRYYRFLYNVVSLLTISPAVIYFLRYPSPGIYSVGMPWEALMRFGQAVGLLMMMVSVWQTGIRRFIGLAPQANSDSGERAIFVRNGLYSLVRHPIYTGTYLFFIFDPQMTEIKLITYIIFGLYIRIGIYFEEKKLKREFGEQYNSYEARVPMLIPDLRRK